MSQAERWDLFVNDDDGKEIRNEILTMTPGEAQQYAADMAKQLPANREVTVWSAERDGQHLFRARGMGKTEWLYLNISQRKLHGEIEQAAGADGADSLELLMGRDALAKDKAVVAEVFGGPGAGAMFRGEHISKRSRCTRCHKPGYYLDGTRDPYWVHDNRAGGHVFTPNDAYTVVGYEKTRR